MRIMSNFKTSAGCSAKVGSRAGDLGGIQMGRGSSKLWDRRRLR